MSSNPYGQIDKQLQEILNIFEQQEQLADQLDQCYQALDEELSLREISARLEQLRSSQGRSTNAASAPQNIPAEGFSLFSITTLLIAVTVVISILLSSLERYFLHMPESLVPLVYRTDMEENEKKIEQTLQASQGNPPPPDWEKKVDERIRTALGQGSLPPSWKTEITTLISTEVGNKLPQNLEDRLVKLEQQPGVVAPTTPVTPTGPAQNPAIDTPCTKTTPEKGDEAKNSQDIAKLVADLAGAKEAQAYMTTTSSQQRTVFVICQELLKIDPKSQDAIKALRDMRERYTSNTDKHRGFHSQIDTLLQGVGQ